MRRFYGSTWTIIRHQRKHLKTSEIVKEKSAFQIKQRNKKYFWNWTKDLWTCPYDLFSNRKPWSMFMSYLSTMDLSLFSLTERLVTHGSSGFPKPTE